MRKVFVVHPGPPLSQHDVWAGWVKALRQLGHEVRSYRTDNYLLAYRQWPPSAEAVLAAQNGLRAVLRRVSPDLVLFIGNSFVSGELLEDVAAPVVLLHTESPYEDRRQLALAPFAAANLIGDPLNLAAYERCGPVHVISPAYDPDVHYPGSGPKDIDFTFIGTALPSRTEFFGKMNLDGLEVCIDGGGFFAPNGIDNATAAGLYRRSRAGINVYRREGDTAEGVAVGPRELEMAACGLFFLRDSRPEGDELFSMLPTFSDPEEASEELRWWLEHGSAREERAIMARDAVKDRTFLAEASKAMKFLESNGT